MTRIQQNDRILFQGDSITDAFRKPAEINEAYQLGTGYVFFNRGVSGNRIANLVERWDADCLALQPTMVSVLIGINDTAHDVGGKPGSSLADYEKHYRTLLTSVPARFVLCEPFALVTGTVTPAWRENLLPRQRLVRQLAAEFGAVFVELQAAFDAAARQMPAEYWIYDGIHPTAAGHALIARCWLETMPCAR
jgi:lysophospholipase L1-like esterase